MKQIDALNQAKKALFLKKDETRDFNFQHPFFWASYTLYGKPDITKQSSNFYKLGLIVLIFGVTLFIVIYFLPIRKK